MAPEPGMSPSSWYESKERSRFYRETGNHGYLINQRRDMPLLLTRGMANAVKNGEIVGDPGF